MKIRHFQMAIGLMLGLLFAGAAGAADQPSGPAPQPPYAHGDEAALPNGVIGVSLQVGAERIGDPAVLYVGMVHPEGPAGSHGGPSK